MSIYFDIPRGGAEIITKGLEHMRARAIIAWYPMDPGVDDAASDAGQGGAPDGEFDG